jgi:ankyrin repeat protein
MHKKGLLIGAAAVVLVAAGFSVAQRFGLFDLQKGADLSQTKAVNDVIGGYDAAALREALIHGHARTAASLIAKHARCNITDPDGRSLLLTAISSNWPDDYEQIRIMALLIRCGSDVNARGPELGLRAPATSVLEQALGHGNARIALWLLAQGADIDKGQRPDFLSAVAAVRDVEVYRELLKRGARLDSRGWNGTTPFLQAVESGNEVAMRFLLDRGVDVNERDSMGRNALHLLTETFGIHARELYVLLLDHGAEINATTGPGFRSNPAGIGLTPLDEAVFNDDSSLVQLFIDRGANVNIPTATGDTALDIAVLAEHFDIAQNLLNQGASIDAPGRPPSTVLYRAVTGHKPRAVTFLLDHHANPNITATGESETGLHAAAREGLTEMLDALISAGANVAVRDRSGHTPLYLAVLSDHVETASHLLARGAQIVTVDRNGLAPVYYARSNAMLALLVQHGAKDPFPSNPGMDSQACNAVMVHANKGRLDDILGKQINGDRLKQSPIDDWDAGPLMSIDSQFSLRQKDTDFVVGFSADDLRYVARLSDDGVEKVICTFSDGPIKEDLARSVEPAFCAAIQSGRQRYPDYNEPVSLEGPTGEDPFISVVSGAARLDLRNDGQNEWVVEVQYSSTHDGCSETYPGVLRPDKKGLDSEQTEPLAKLASACGSDVKAFIYNQATYIEVDPRIAAHPSERQILKLVGAQSTEMCRILAHRTYSTGGTFERH